MENGELALGQNVTIAYMTWYGYNYEDAIIMSERMVADDVYTSIHLEEYDIDCRDTKLGPEEITRDIPNVGENAVKKLDANGVIMVGAEVREGDILVGKVTPKGQSEVSPEEKLLLAIFGEKSREVRDNSLKVPHGGAGIVHSIRTFKRGDGSDLPPGVNERIKVYIAQKRKISEGDKMSGRHGNKGVISKILPLEDMPFMADGTPLQIVLNPLGVPSRMNIGQIMETHLGWGAKELGRQLAELLDSGAAMQVLRREVKDVFGSEEVSALVDGMDDEEFVASVKKLRNGIVTKTPVFDSATEDEIWGWMDKAGMENDGKTTLYDGRTGVPFRNRVTTGVMYILKLHHLVDEKIHARSTGPYSLVTQQPLGGKAQFGGQRLGEMEVWALEAYGAAYLLQEFLTVKSDDVAGRVKIYKKIVKGDNFLEAGLPESFNVLVKELMSLGLDVTLHQEEGKKRPKRVGYMRDRDEEAE